ncbi:hypothetical protein SAMN06265222_104203 [Neorhodopirellula lusitana]|uniref:Uncharacterized protein n=1 Tax=Neorhodopirellula lusitana TaxID=445327 RepID=A0ABY1PZH7_9BACT|nr:hypothetical protein [Neorhodopirellula lusitana]SMP54100.1 hypothetical protein SAMN06265222_104203 [Neorhodopirellula lusitana]
MTSRDVVQIAFCRILSKSNSRMTPSQQLARVRRSLQHWLESHPQEDVNATEENEQGTDDLRESIFVCDGFYRGRRFRTAAIAAVWFAEEDELKIHSAAGQCLASLDAAGIAELAGPEVADVLPMIRSAATPPTAAPSTETPQTEEAQPLRRAA